MLSDGRTKPGWFATRRAAAAYLASMFLLAGCVLLALVAFAYLAFVAAEALQLP